MILYDPLEGDVSYKDIQYRPRTCFIMTQLGKPVPSEIKNIRRNLEKRLKERKYRSLDAQDELKGKDFLLKIWGMIVSVPIGIAIISKDISANTLANIFYEIGLLQSYGKEILIIKTKDANVPSDFVRTEYLEYGRNFKSKINKFLDGLEAQAAYYARTSDLLSEKPLIAIDYLKRAYLLTGELKFKEKVKKILDLSHFDSHTEESIKSFL